MTRANNAQFRSYLKQSGRSTRAADRCINRLAEFTTWLQSDPAAATSRDLHEFVAHIEKERSPNTHLWALAYYFDFVGDNELAAEARRYRSERIEPKRVALVELIGLAPDLVAALRADGITHTDQLLALARNPEALSDAAARNALPPDGLEDAIEMSRFTQIRGVAGTRARLYRDCVGTLGELASLRPHQLITAAELYLAERETDWIPPSPAEAAFTVDQARRISRSQ